MELQQTKNIYIKIIVRIQLFYFLIELGASWKTSTSRPSIKYLPIKTKNHWDIFLFLCFSNFFLFYYKLRLINTFFENTIKLTENNERFITITFRVVINLIVRCLFFWRYRKKREDNYVIVTQKVIKITVSDQQKILYSIFVPVLVYQTYLIVPIYQQKIFSLIFLPVLVYQYQPYLIVPSISRKY